MECNKDEAVRAKQLADTKMQRGEFVDALKFAKKAKNLYAGVENIAQILAVCEVHNAAMKKLCMFEMDYYGILRKILRGINHKDAVQKARPATSS